MILSHMAFASYQEGSGKQEVFNDCETFMFVTLPSVFPVNPIRSLGNRASE